jgi:hypothetical protein
VNERERPAFCFQGYENPAAEIGFAMALRGVFALGRRPEIPGMMG